MSTAAIAIIAFLVGTAVGAFSDMIVSEDSCRRNCSRCKYRLDADRSPRQ